MGLLGKLGNQTRVKVVKNKMAPPFKQTEFEILYGEGISRLGEVIDLGVAQDLIKKSGAWYSYQGNKIGQGKENVRQYLKENTAVAEEVETELRRRLLPDTGGKARADDVADDVAEAVEA